MAESSLLIARGAAFRDHRAARSHPECPERLDAIDRALDGTAIPCTEVPLRAAADDELLRVHRPELVAQLDDLAGHSGQLDPDTYLSPRSTETARLAAGTAIELAERIAKGEAARGFALVRPPGHHAEADRAMGFCLINHVAVVAAALRARGFERIAIVDFDVHHGNGTQHSFEAERDTLFLSSHQFPFYPGTGSLAERGRDAGEGATVNLPLPAGCGDGEYAAVYEAVAFPVLRAFAPDFVLVSAGFDAHRDDPLASMRLSADGFARIVKGLREVANASCDGRLLFTLEGGYDLTALGRSVAASIDVLAGGDGPAEAAPPAAPAFAPVLDEIRAAHADAWPVLRRRNHA